MCLSDETPIRLQAFMRMIGSAMHSRNRLTAWLVMPVPARESEYRYPMQRSNDEPKPI